MFGGALEGGRLVAGTIKVGALGGIAHARKIPDVSMWCLTTASGACLSTKLLTSNSWGMRLDKNGRGRMSANPQ